ncbi:MAG TPA: PAS domain-containing sensor histidine kinase [Candidatus Saccharimonadales bacterium]|nr:PAS domain-containing sensor histidine kinase [Candidatus Saccharimonadales bacterium]
MDKDVPNARSGHPVFDWIGHFFHKHSTLPANGHDQHLVPEPYRQIVEMAGEGIWAVDNQMRTTLVNQRMAHLLGYSTEEIIGRSPADFVDETERDRTLHKWRNGCENHRFDHDFRFRSKNGSEVWTACSVTPFHDGDGRFIGAFAILAEETQRRRQAEEFQKSEHRAQRNLGELEMIYQQVPAGLAFLDHNLRFIKINDRLARLNGCPVHEHIGRTLREIVPHQADTFEHLLLYALETGEPLENIEFSCDMPDQPGVNRYWLASYYPAHINGTRGINVVVMEITDRKRAEAALQQSQADLKRYAETLEQRVAERTAKLEQTVQSLEGVCYHVAHDLRAPLRAMEGFTNILLKQYTTHLDEQGQDFARRISQAATRMDHLIRDLLDYGRLSHAKLTFGPLELEGQLARVMGHLQEEIEHCGASIDVSVPLGHVWANPTVVDQVLTNLLSNAMKYVPPGTIPSIKIQAEEKGAFIRLWVKDNGIGIAPEHQERVFRVFERLHRNEQYPGTGIGLAIVFKGIEIMGGRVGLESEEGKGSKFWIELPREQPGT